LAYLPYILCFVLMAIGIYGMVAKKNVIKIIIGLAVTEYAINMFLVVLGWRAGENPVAPILAAGQEDFLANTVDPLPQALVLTSIVVGLGVLALAVALAVRLYQKYGTFDITEIRKLRG